MHYIGDKVDVCICYASCLSNKDWFGGRQLGFGLLDTWLNKLHGESLS
jgi:hypothetical protein